jgi:predicted nucleic acid-binding protein
MIVIDASAVIDLLLDTPRAGAIDRRLSSSGQTIHAPHLLDVEVIQVIRRFWMGKQLDKKRAAEAISDYADLPIERYPHQLLLGRIWELRQNLTAYDAAYVALAEALDVPLLTTDARLASAPAARQVAELIR